MKLTTNWQELFRYHINVGSNRLVPFVTYAKVNTQKKQKEREQSPPFCYFTINPPPRRRSPS